MWLLIHFLLNEQYNMMLEIVLVVFWPFGLPQISGANVVVHDPKPGAAEGVVIVSGAPDQTHFAQSLIQAFILCGQTAAWDNRDKRQSKSSLVVFIPSFVTLSLWGYGVIVGLYQGCHTIMWIQVQLAWFCWSFPPLRMIVSAFFIAYSDP